MPRNRPEWATCGNCRAPRGSPVPPPPPARGPPRRRSAFDPTPSVLNAVDAVTAGIRYLLGLTVAECLQAEHWVEEARRHLSGEYVLAGRDLGEEHATTIGLYFQSAQTLYKLHFFGGEGYRRMLIDSLGMHSGIHVRSGRVLGVNHPLTKKIAVGFLMCFEEQLDWSLGDIPSDYLAYRARLLGD